MFPNWRTRRTMVSRLHGAIGLVLILAGAWAGIRAEAGQVNEFILPLAGTAKKPSGLKLVIHSRWVDGYGYRPMTLELATRSGAPTVADRRFDVELTPSQYGWEPNAAVKVRQAMLLPQGSRSVTTTVAIPQFEDWHGLDINVYEDGRKVPDLCEQMSFLSRNWYQAFAETAPSLLVIDSHVPSRKLSAIRQLTAPKSTSIDLLPDVRSLAARVSLVEGNNNNGFDYTRFDSGRPIDDNGLLRLVDDLDRFEMLPPDELPDEWICWSGIDVILLSRTELNSLAEQHPAKLSALRQWTLSGRTLVVWDAGDQYERSAQIETMLQITASSSGEGRRSSSWRTPQQHQRTAQVSALANVYWYKQQQSSRGAIGPVTNGPVTNGPVTNGPVTNGPVTNGPVTNGPVVNGPAAAVPANDANAEKADPVSAPFRWREAGAGTLVLYAAANPFSGDERDWIWLFNSLDARYWMSLRRYGLSLNHENPDFWNLMIPGVGAAPVHGFLVLISLFVVVIGPVNYLFLRRRGQLYLMLVTVPAAAFLVTASLFLYAAVADGFGVRLRVRSLTLLDQRSQTAVAWSRQSYYAGLTPSGGLTFPRDAVVLPLHYRPRSRDNRFVTQHQLRWEEDAQVLSSGYLPARTSAQVLVMESRSSTARLEFPAAERPGEPPRVVNHLGVAVQQVLFTASDGLACAAGGIPAGKAVQAHVLTADERVAWKKLFTQHQPAPPIGFDGRNMRNAGDFFWGANSYTTYWNQIDSGSAGPTTAASWLEQQLRQIALEELVQLPPRAYVAIVERSPEVHVGMTDLREESSFHVVRGDW